MSKAEIGLKVHITGVYGLIGNLVYQHLNQRGEHYGVFGSARRSVGSDRTYQSAIVKVPDSHFSSVDLGDAPSVLEAFQGMDAVLHIAAVPDPGAPFADILHSNIVGTPSSAV